MKLTVDKIAAVTGGVAVRRGRGECELAGTDSRNIEAGKLFVPIVGERFDGHDYISAALDRGAAGFLFSKEKLNRRDAAKKADEKNAVAVEVADTLDALGELAKAVRDSIEGLKVVAITGSTGKSTTKEMTASILGGSRRLAKNEGNLNNLVGLPITFFGMPEELDIAVVEMGTNTPGEIARLSYIAGPDAACVTNVGPVHLEGLRSIEGVAREKGALPEALNEDGIFAVNCDDPYVRDMAQKTGAKPICYGLGNERLPGCGEFVTAEDIRAGEDFSTFVLNTGEGFAQTIVAAPGMHNVLNALAAAALARAMGEKSDAIAEGLQNWKSMSMRSEVRKIAGKITVLVDCYNSNPASLKAAMDMFENFNGRRVAVVGDMLELGDYTEEAHMKAGETAADAGVELLVAVGRWAEISRKGFINKIDYNADALVAKDADEVVEMLLKRIKKGDVLLVKGSRLLKLETVVDAISARWDDEGEGD